MLNLDLETAKFIKNADNTYTIHQPIGDGGMLSLPRVAVEIKAEALVDETVGDYWQYIEYDKPQKKHYKSTILLSKIKSFGASLVRRAKDYEDCIAQASTGHTPEVYDLKKCTMCGKEFDLWDEQENFCFDHHIGYGSKYDGDKVRLNLCCDCFDKVIDTIIPMCKESPIVEE